MLRQRGAAVRVRGAAAEERRKQLLWGQAGDGSSCGDGTEGLGSDSGGCRLWGAGERFSGSGEQL